MVTDQDYFDEANNTIEQLRAEVAHLDRTKAVWKDLALKQGKDLAEREAEILKLRNVLLSCWTN